MSAASSVYLALEQHCHPKRLVMFCTKVNASLPAHTRLWKEPQS